ncbi:hypothetical protein LAZ67_12001015 [Cordylochernes scorpioides]|uniref:Uncharacterized protein n=1 Tax=Cordylochernes scorpioides TaxID=51811 RepID=A0ABY6L2V8_9ARAC|nr:hypothetical protein LAZ67_12001015 [Cordylochernes scorpioides]
MGKRRDLSYDLLGHSPYSSDLASSDFHLFPHLKIYGYFNSLPDSHCLEEFLVLMKHWTKCLMHRQDIVPMASDMSLNPQARWDSIAETSWDKAYLCRWSAAYCSEKQQLQRD